MSINIDIKPVHVATSTIVASLETALAKQRADRNRVEELKGEDFDAFAAVLTGDQKEHLVNVIRSYWGSGDDTPDDLARRNDRDAEMAAIQRQTRAQQQDAGLLALLGFYSNITDKEVEVAPDDGILQFLTYDDSNAA